MVYIILKLISLKIPDSPFESHIKKIINNKDRDLPFILELVDSTFEREIRDLIMPIIDPETSFNNADKENLALGPNELLKLWSESNNDWKSAIAVNFLLNGYKNNNVNIDWEKIAPSPLLAEIFNKIPSEQIDIPINKFKNKMEPIMYSVIEKTIILKTVDLFQDIPGELLSKISQISKAKHYPAKETVFKEGDSGNSMYIVIEGTVSIKKSNKLLADLEKGSSLGEMALLDHETRSADAIAKTDSVLLKINQDIFFELMESNADIMKQIIKLLTSRIRKANLKLEKTLQ